MYLVAVALPHCMDFKLFIDLGAVSGNFSRLLICPGVVILIMIVILFYGDNVWDARHRPESEGK